MGFIFIRDTELENAIKDMLKLMIRNMKFLKHCEKGRLKENESQELIENYQQLISSVKNTNNSAYSPFLQRCMKEIRHLTPDILDNLKKEKPQKSTLQKKEPIIYCDRDEYADFPPCRHCNHTKGGGAMILKFGSCSRFCNIIYCEKCLKEAIKKQLSKNPENKLCPFCQMKISSEALENLFGNSMSYCHEGKHFCFNALALNCGHFLCEKCLKIKIDDSKRKEKNYPEILCTIDSIPIPIELIQNVSAKFTKNSG